MEPSQPTSTQRRASGETDIGEADPEKLSTTVAATMGKSKSASTTRHSSGETEIGEVASEDVQSSTTTAIRMEDSQSLNTTETVEAGSAPADSPDASNATVNQSEIPKVPHHKSGETQTSDWMKEYQPANESNESSTGKESGTVKALASFSSLPLMGALALTLATVA